MQTHSSRFINVLLPDATTLRRLYADDRLNTRQIAERYAVNLSAVKAALHWYEIPLRPPHMLRGGTMRPRTPEHTAKVAAANRFPVPPRTELAALYTDAGMNISALSVRFGVSRNLIRVWLADYAIERRPPRKGSRFHTHPSRRVVFGEEERPEVCVLCGSTRFIIVHHLDEDRAHNTSENLQVLCSSCHRKVHNSVQYLRKRDVSQRPL